MVYHRVFFVQCCVYVCTNIYTQTDIRVCLLEKVQVPPPPPTSTLQKRLGGPKTSKQTRDRRHKVRHFIFLLTFTVFAVVLCGVRSHSPRLPLRPLLKLDPPLPSHSSDEGWKVFPACGKEEGSDVVH